MTQDDNTRKWLGELIQNTTDVELKMQDEILEILNYVDHGATVPLLLDESTAGENGKLYQLVSFMAPCPWTYYEIADKISKENRVKDKVAKRWVDFYSSFESKQQVDLVVHLLNEVSIDLTNHEKTDMKSYFDRGCVNELNFWNIAYNHRPI